MAKVSDESRSQLKNAIAPYKEMIEKAISKEKAVGNAMRSDPERAYKQITLGDDMIDVASYYMAQNALSVKMLDVKNNDALNDARKMLYKAIIYLEEVVTNYIDVSYADLAEPLASIAKLTVKQRYEIIQKLGLAINMLKNAFGDNSKWRWSFVELEGRYAVVAKNLIDMKQGVKDYFDPNSDNYETSVLYIRLIGKLLDLSASGYRDRYELSTRRIDDMKSAIKFLLARHKVFVAIGDKQGAEDVKKKAVVWNEKLEADLKAGSSK